MAEKSYVHKKRIVYTALKPFFKEIKLIQAMILWEKKYANLPSSEVQRFVYDIKNTLDASADIRGIHLNLIRAASLPEDKLQSDPTTKIRNYLAKSGKSLNADYRLPELEIAEVFLEKWRTYLSAMEYETLVEYVIENLHHQNVDPILSMELTSWLNDNVEQIKIPNADNSDLRKIINLYYVASCEIVGPIKTDQILSKVVNGLKSNGYANFSELIDRII